MLDILPQAYFVHQFLSTVLLATEIFMMISITRVTSQIGTVSFDFLLNCLDLLLKVKDCAVQIDQNMIGAVYLSSAVYCLLLQASRCYLTYPKCTTDFPTTERQRSKYGHFSSSLGFFSLELGTLRTESSLHLTKSLSSLIFN